MSPRNDVGTIILVQTTLVTYTQAFLVGAGYSSIYVSVIYYLQEYFKDHANLYFCLIMSSTSLATFLGSYLLKRFKILRRNLKITLLVISLLSCLGNLCYSFHSTVWLLMIGRFICGFGDTAPEIVRATMGSLLPVNQFKSFSSKYQIMYMTGFLIGPVLVSLLFKYKASFDSGLLLIDKYNGIAFILFWMFAALCLLMLCCVSDLNDYVIEEKEKEEEAEEVKVIIENAEDALFDEHAKRLNRSKKYETEYLQRKKHQQQQHDKNENNHPSRTTDQGEQGSSSTLAKFIMVFFMLLNFFSNSTEMIVVMVAVRKLNVTIATLCALVVCCLFVFMVILTRLWGKMFDHESKKFLSGVGCIVISITANISIIFASQESFNKHLRIFFIFLTILLNSMCGFTAADSAQNIISVIIPPNNKIFEQISTWWIPFYRIFGITGLLLAGFLLKFTTVIYTTFVVVQVLFLSVLYRERNKFKTE